MLRQFQPVYVVRRAHAELSQAKHCGNFHDYYTGLTAKLYKLPNMAENEEIHFFMKGLRPNDCRWVLMPQLTLLIFCFCSVWARYSAAVALNYNQLYLEVDGDRCLNYHHYDDDSSNPPTLNNPKIIITVSLTVMIPPIRIDILSIVCALK